MDTLLQELKRPQVLIGLGLFLAASVVLWHAWRGKETPFPIGMFMPF